MKKLIGCLIYKKLSSPNFIRRIEWRKNFGCCLRWGGALSLKIAEKGCEVYGINLSKNAIKCAKRLSEREKIACEFEVGRAEDLPSPIGHFDKIVCSSSLEHFKNDLKALKEMHRVLKPDGSIVLTTDSFTYPTSDDLKEKHREIAYVVNYYTQETLKERLKSSGFEMLRSKYLLNSRITSFFFKVGIKIRWSGILWMAISIIVYPLCLISDKLFGVRDK